MAIGHKPNSDIFKDQLSLNESGYIITEADSTVTSVKGVLQLRYSRFYLQTVTMLLDQMHGHVEAERFLEGH